MILRTWEQIIHKQIFHCSEKQEHICQNKSQNTNQWYEHTLTLQEVHTNKLFHLYHAHPGMTYPEDSLKDIVFSPDECIEKQNASYRVNKCRFKFENLQTFCYVSNEQPKDGLWDTIPRHCENTILKSMKELNITITGSRNKYISQLFKYSRTTVSYRR